MKELTFFTSNSTKLAHARYIAESYPVRIKGFRQRTYHANYNEPRVSSRNELLQASYQSALRQCEKAGLSTDSHPFILEDTSVKIDALSHDEAEVPGVDIKYWMEGQTLSKVDALLKAQMNRRTATVRSDVLLHIPRSLRSSWQIDDEYIVFVGQQAGSIADTEANFEANLVYPWLDNVSFNKWFIPEGLAEPFGALQIDVADLVDFRRKAFEQLFNFLMSRRYLIVDQKQLAFGLERKSSLILSGYTCAGKTTASQHLARKFGYLHVEASDFMYLSYYYRHGYRGDISIGDFAEHALAQKPNIAAEKVAEYISDNIDSPVVVSGFRSPREIEHLEQALSPLGKNFSVVFVDSDQLTRFERLRARMRPGDDISLEQFSSRDEQQRRMGLDEIKEASGTYHLENDDSLENYSEAMDAYVGPTFQDEIDVLAALGQARDVSDVGLEDAILIALLGAWTSDETHPFFSTTQVARMIKETFVKVAPKHKDNVSRYFNQDFYAYYEIAGERLQTKRRYRLSNTGYGKAIRSLRSLLKSTKPMNRQ